MQDLQPAPASASDVPVVDRTLEELAQILAGTETPSNLHIALARTLSKSMQAERLADLNRPCSTCVHHVLTNRSYSRCIHPLVAAVTYNPISGQRSRDAQSCNIERTRYDWSTPCDAEGKLHLASGHGPFLNRILARLRDRRLKR